MLVDLRNHIVTKAGTWTDAALLAGEQPMFTLADTYTPSKLMMRWPNDSVTLVGPLRVRVSFQSENVTYPVGFDPTSVNWIEQPSESDSHALAPVDRKANLIHGALGVHANTVYSYVLEIPAAQAWPFRFREEEVARKLGTNFGYRVIVEPAFETPASTCVRDNDLPCDFATISDPDTGRFFPAACEPCAPGASIGLPPLGPGLAIPSADGGCIRPRWFNGQFITREDLETEQRYFRLKQKLQNRAMGDGVVWGFAVGKAGNHVCVMPGYGVDCCGNDLTLSSVYRVDIATLLRDPAAVAGYSVPTGVYKARQLMTAAPASALAPAMNIAAPGPANASAPNANTPNTSNNAVALAAAPAPNPAVYERPSRAILDRSCFEPAVFDPRIGVRMHLLLEYVECPSEPRPVHSDPCAGTANRCEMSRIRETVRLRLVPPRDYTIQGPLKVFLDRVSALRAAHPITETNVPLDTTAVAPFRFRLTLVTAQGETSTTFAVDKPPPTMSAQSAIQSVKLSLVADPMWVFAEGVMRATDGRGQSLPGSPFELGSPDVVSDPPSVQMAMTDTGAELDVQLDRWVAQRLLATNDAVLSGTATLRVTRSSTNQVSLVAGESNANIGRGRLEFFDPCVGEACQSSSYYTNNFERPVLPHMPFLHDDPVDRNVAGDPKALVLAGLGAWLTRILASHRSGPVEEYSSKRTLATGLYEGVWMLFYGQQQGLTPAATSEALCLLFRDWCEAFLYKGPKCQGEPHGVVIGCTTVTGGTIGDIDMYGGRRWVMHGPLIGHWMGQIGLAPVDVMASRFMSQLCCVASLPSIGVLDALPAIVIKLNRGYLTFGAPDDVKAKLQSEQNISITRAETVGFIDMIQRFTEAQQDPITSTQATRYSIGSPFQDRVLSIVIPQDPQNA